MLETQLSIEYAQQIVETVREPLLVIDSEFRVKHANAAFYRNFQLEAENVHGRFIFDLCEGQWNHPDFRKLLEDILPHRKYFENLELDCEFKKLGRRRLLLNGRSLDELNMILLAIEDITERKNAEELMKESNVRLKLALEAGNMGTWDLDYRTGTLAWTDTTRDMFGVPADAQLSEEYFLSLVHPDDLPRLKEAKERALLGESGGDYNVEFRCVRPDGTVRWVKARGRVLFDAEHTPVRFLGSAVDITETKHAELALRSSEAWLRLLTDATPQIVWTAQPDGQRDYWSKQWFEYTGAKYEDCVGWQWTRFLPKADLERVLPIWKHAVESGENFEAEYRIKRADGVYRWHLVRALPVRDESGRIMRWFGTATDIDEKRRAEEERTRYAEQERERRAEAENAERRAAFLAQASETLTSSLDYLTTLTGVAHLAVPQFADMCNVDIAESGGAIRRVAMSHSNKTALDIEHQLERRYPPRLDDPYGAGAVLRAGRSQWWAQVADSLLFAMAREEEHLKLLRESNIKSYIVVPMIARGRTMGAITFGLTESNRKYEGADVSLAEDLGRRAGLAVDNARLFQEAQQALFTAKKAVGSRDELLAIVSHDLKNPVNAIKLSADLVKEFLPAGSKAHKPVETIKHSVDRMHRLIGDLLDIASIDARTLSIQRQSCNAAQLVEQVFEMLEPMASKHGVTLKRKISPDLRSLNGDPARIIQVLSNLIGNGIKFTPAGGLVTVRAGQRGAEICFSITDTGMGIPEDQFEHLFDRYWQATQGTRAGVGLGLAIAKGIVESHGGQIWVESTVGAGSTFYFTIPVIP